MNPPRYKFERKDTTHVDSSQRPTIGIDHYIDIIELAKDLTMMIIKLLNTPFPCSRPII